MEHTSIWNEVRRSEVGELNHIVVWEVPAGTENGTSEISGGATVVVNGDVVGGDGGYESDVAGRARLVTDGDEFVGNEGVAMGWVEDWTRAGGDGAVREYICDGAFEFSAGRILSHAVGGVGQPGSYGTRTTPRSEVAGSAAGC